MNRRKGNLALGLAACCALVNSNAALRTHAAPPTVQYLFPAGVERGQSLEVAAGGSFEKWPVQVWVDRPGLNVTCGGDKGKFSIAAASDAIPGVYWLRLYDAEGATAPVPFVVGTIAEIAETEPNDLPSAPQTLGGTQMVVNGRLEKRGDVDVFELSLAEGQTLAVSLEANRLLGSPMDGVLQIVSSRGIVLAQNDDERGLDPLLVFPVPADGTYLVRTFAFPAAADASVALAGGENYVYRLTMTTGGLLDAALPLAVARGAAVQVEACGWNIPSAEKFFSLLPPEGAENVELFHPHWAGSLSLAVVPWPSLVEAEPNDAGRPQPIALPATVSGLIGEPRDGDVYAFAAKKGEPLQFTIESRRLGYPLDAVLEVFDGAGKSLARVDDAGQNADAELTFNPPADAEYRVSVSDLFEHGGPRYIYRLHATRVEPDFALTVANHAWTVSHDKPAEIAVTIERRHGFAEEIIFDATGLPDGIVLAPTRSLPEGESAKAVKLTLAAAKGPFSGPIRLTGRAAGAQARTRVASAALPGRSVRTEDVWLTILPGDGP